MEPSYEWSSKAIKLVEVIFGYNGNVLPSETTKAPLSFQDLHKAAAFCTLTKVKFDNTVRALDLIFHIDTLKMARYLEKQDYGMFELVVPKDGKISLWKTLIEARFAATPQQIENFRKRYLPNGKNKTFQRCF